MTKPTVSVLMPVYNGARFVVEAVRSVQAQTVKDWELLVVDDASTDDSMTRLRELSENDSRVKIICRSHNSGSPATPRNDALSRAEGEYIALLDQDDVWLPRKLEIQLRMLAADGAGLVYSDANIRYPDGNERSYAAEWGPQHEGVVAESLLRGNFIPALTAMMPRAVAKSTGLFDRNLPGVDDYDYWLRIALSGHRFKVWREPLATWMLRDHNMTLDQDAHLRTVEACLRKHLMTQPAFAPIIRQRIRATRRQRQRWNADQMAFAPWNAAIARHIAKCFVLIRSPYDARVAGASLWHRLKNGSDV